MDLILPDSGQDEKAIGQSSFKMILPGDAPTMPNVDRKVRDIIDPPPESYDPQAAAITREAASTTPESFARARALAIKARLPIPTVERNTDSIAIDQKSRDMQSLMLANPILNQQMRDPSFAKLSADDGPALSRIETWKNAVGPDPSVSSVVRGLWETLPNSGSKMREGIRQQFADVAGFDTMGADATRRAAQAAARDFLSTPNFESDTAQAIYGGAKSFVNLLPGAAASIAAGNPLPGLALIFGQTQPEAYSKYRARGGKPGESFAGATAEGGLEVATELLPMGFLVKRFGKAGFGELVTGILARELPGEIANTIASNAVDTAVANPEKTWGQYFQNLPGDLYQTAIATVTQSLLTAGIGAGAKYVAQRDAKEQQAAQGADAIKELMALSADVKVRALAPDTFAKFVDEAHPDQAVYVDGATFAQAATAAGVNVAQSMPETASRLADAVATKSDVRIPLGELAAVAPGTTLEQAIVPHLRVDPTAPTQQEIADKKYAAETEEKAARILAEQNFTDAFKASADTVRNELMTQLKQAGRFTEDVNKAKAAYATAMYSTVARRLGITPEEAYVRYPLDIVARGLPTDLSLQHGPRATTSKPLLNVGLDIGSTPDAVKPEAIIQSLADMGIKAIVRGVVRSDTENTAVVETDRPLTAAEADALSQKHQQEAIAQYANDQGELHGPAKDKWGPFNPRFFRTADGNTMLAQLLPAYGTAREGAVSAVGVHFSPKEGLNTLSSAHYGQGMKGAEQARTSQLDQKYRERVHFYLPQGEGVRAESGVGGNAYAAQLNNLYDADADPLNLALNNKGNEFDKAVADAGFNGYLSRATGTVTLIGQHNVPVTALGNEAEANAAVGKSRPPEEVKTQQRKVVDNMLLQRDALPGGQMSPAEWNQEIQRKRPDVWPYVPASVWQGTDPIYLSDIAKAMLQAPVSFYQSEANSSQWAYSELLNQLEHLPKGRVPADGLLPEQWQALLVTPATTKTVALRDANNKPTGETKTTEVAARVNLPGVKMAEIDASGIMDWFPLIGDRPAKWFAMNADGSVNSGVLDEESGKRYIAGREGMYLKTTGGKKKITQSAVLEYLRANQLILEERHLSADGPSGEIEYTEGEFETDEPDMYFISDRARDNEDIHREAYAEKKGIEESEVDTEDEDYIEFAEEREVSWYYEDSESPQTMHATVTLPNGDEVEFQVNVSYGDTNIYDITNSRDVQHNRRSDIEQDIRAYVEENYGVNGSQQSEYHDYQLPGSSKDYVEILLKYPGNKLFSAPHFDDSENLMVHFRANTRIVDVNDLGDEFKETKNNLSGRVASVFFVEEIQSDWAQAGRDKGFGKFTEKDAEELTRLYASAPRTDEQQERLLDLESKKASNGLHPAPFVTSTDAVHALAVKRILRYAAEHGHDLVAWTRGDQQTARWSGALRKNVDVIKWTKTPEGVHLIGEKISRFQNPARINQYNDGNADFYSITTGNGELIANRVDTREEAEQIFAELPFEVRHAERVSSREVVNTTYAENMISDAIGKAMGNQILSDPNQSGEISGDNITIDSVGMSQVYGDADGKKGDGTPAIIPKAFAAVSKKLGGSGKINSVVMDVGAEVEGAIANDGTRQHAVMVDRVLQDTYSTKAEADAEVKRLSIQPVIELTPKLKESIMKGVPLFQQQQGQITFSPVGLQQPTQLALLANANLSTFFHEMGHFYLEVLTDMAAMENAPADVVADFNTLMKWFGVAPQDWAAMSLEQRRPYHEQFARGNEAYLFEGKAPSIELQPLFQRFRSWMLNVYRYLTGAGTSEEFQTNYAKGVNQPVLQLTDEVRSVLDRMLATNNEIVDMENSRNFLPIFDSKPEGVTDDDWIAYHKLGEDASQEAVDQLQTRSLKDMQYASNARAQVLKELQKQAGAQRRAVRTEVTAEVKAEPVYQAQRFLRTGKIITPAGEEVKTDGSFKLDRAAVEEMYPESMVNRPPVDRIDGLMSRDGVSPDTIAEMFGFKSGDELVRALANLEPMKEKIAGLTDQRMLERYGDMADQRSIERAADEAVHNEVRSRFVATELHMLEKAVGERRTLLPAAKAFAEGLIANKRVRDVRPSQYSAAAARAAANAKGVLRAGDTATAAAEKRAQIVNIYAAKAAHTARDEVDKGVAYLKRVGESKTIDPEYRDQIAALLDRFDLRAMSEREAKRRQSLAQWIESQGELAVIDPALVNEANRKPYQEMTVAEFRGLVDSVRNIEHLGRLKHKLLTIQDKRELARIVEEAAASIHMHAKRTVPPVLERNSWIQKVKDNAAQYYAMHFKFASIIREMDGWEDNGTLWNLFVRQMNAAGDREAVMREQATEKLTALLDPIRDLKMREKMHIPAINASLSREGRITVALNAGNAGNLQRMMDGDRWSQQQVQAIINTLTKPEMDFVQNVWNFIAGYRDQIGAQQKRLTGVEPDWVEPTPVQTPHGEYAGGYYPAKYDGTRSSKALADEAAAGLLDQWRAKYGAAAARAGFTKARAESVSNRPLKKDLGVLFQHVTEVTHRLAWQDWLVDVNKLLRASAIDTAIREHYGPEVLSMMRKAIEDIARGDVPAENVLESTANYLRTGATVVGLGWRVTTSLLQPLGLTQSMVRIGPKWVARGMAEWLGDAAHMENSAKRIYEKSDFMRLRGKTMMREISEIRNQVAGRNSAIENSYFYLIQKMQLVADIPTWLGQYQKSIAEGVTEDKAVALADQAVLDAQGGGQIKDLSAVQRGSPLLKLFTNFYSFFNTTFNLAREATGRTDFKSPVSMAFLAVDFLLLWVIPSVLNSLMKYALGDDDDEKKLWRTLASDQASYMLGSMIGLREIGAGGRALAGLPADYGGPAGLRFFTEVAKLGKQTNQLVESGFDPSKLDEAFWKSAANTTGILFHLPTGQVASTFDGMVALAQGKTDNPGVLLVGSSKK